MNLLCVSNQVLFCFYLLFSSSSGNTYEPVTDTLESKSSKVSIQSALAKLTETGDIVIELGSVLYRFMLGFGSAYELPLYPQCFPQNKLGNGREMVVCL